MTVIDDHRDLFNEFRFLGDFMDARESGWPARQQLKRYQVWRDLWNMNRQHYYGFENTRWLNTWNEILQIACEEIK